MANVKISQLPEATAIQDTNVFPSSLGTTVTNKISWETIKKALLDQFYPVGSIYTTGYYSEPSQVANILGGGCG